MPKDVIITPANSFIELRDVNSNVDAMIYLDNSRNLNIINPNGQLTFGTTAANVYIGDGTSVVDIIFEQNGSVRALTGKTLTLGQSDSSVNVAANITGGLRVSSGNVGIGTTNPLEKLMVSGNVYLGIMSSASTEGSVFLGRSDGTQRFHIIKAFNSGGSAAENYLRFALHNSTLNTTTDVLTLLGSGNVGIGTTSPTANLHVIGTANVTNSLVVDSGNITMGTATTYGELQIANNTLGTSIDNTRELLRLSTTSSNADHLEFFKLRTSAGSNWQSAGWRIQQKVDSTWHGYIQFNGDNDNGITFGTGANTVSPRSVTERMRINNSGNVGIGTTNPATRLHVFGGNIQHTGDIRCHPTSNTAQTSAWMTFDGHDNGNAIYLGGGGLTVIGGGESSGAVRGNIAIDDERLVLASDASGTNPAFQFNANLQNGWANTVNVMTMLGNGNVGIGTTSPADKLDVYGSIVIRSAYNLSWGGTYGANIPTIVGVSGAGAYLAVYPSGSSNSERLRITDVGNIGIGTSSPGYVVTNRRVVAINGGSGAGEGALLAFMQGGTNKGYLYSAQNTMELWSESGGVTIGNNASAPIDFKTNNQTRMYILGTGNVGIGTTNPANKLDVYIGDISIRATEGVGTRDNRLLKIFRGSLGADQAGVIFGTGPSTENWFIGHPYSGGGVFNALVISEKPQINDGTATLVKTPIMYFTPGAGTAAGSVGIGTTSPGVRLDVVQPVNDTIIRSKTTAAGAYFSADSASDGYYGYSMYNGATEKWFIGGYGTTDLQFALTKTSSELMRITRSGNVGIGTTGAAAKLDIYPGGSDLGVGANGIRVQRPASYGQYGYLEYLISSDITVLGSLYTGGGASAFGQIYLRQHSSTTSRDSMVINGSGNVGIGTTNPASLLNLHAATPDLIINGTGTSNFGVKIRYNGSATHGLHLTYTPNDATAYIDNTYQVNAGTVYGDIYFRQNVAGTMTTRMTIKADGGNVGINMTPVEKLDVTGNIRASGNVISISDERVKIDIETIQNALSKVLNLRGVSYTKKDSGAKQIGVIAQEVNKVIPEVVSYTETDDRYSVAYGNLVGLLIEAIKEQNVRIIALEEKLEGK